MAVPEENVGADQNEIAESESLKKAMSFVVGLGLPKPKAFTPKNLDEVEFPEDVTKLSLEELGRQIGIWSAVLAYVQYEVAKADVDRMARDNQLTFEEKKEYLRMEGTEKKKEARLMADDRLARLRVRLDQAKARHKLLDALYKGYSRYYTALSRELSRRGITPEDPPDTPGRPMKKVGRGFFARGNEDTEHME